MNTYNGKKTIELKAGVGCLLWVWLLFFSWAPFWKEGLAALLLAYLIERISLEIMAYLRGGEVK